VEIRSGQRLPGVCHSCGVPTRTTKRLTAASEPQGTTFTSGIGEFIAHIIKPFGFIDGMEGYDKTVKLSLVLPTCKQCARVLRHITPHYVDFDATALIWCPRRFQESDGRECIGLTRKGM